MKKFSVMLAAVFAAALCAGAAPATVPGTVNVTDFLNVRIGPGLRYPVTGRLNPGQEVKILRIMGNWLELQAPENLKIYVSEARVNVEGKLTGELNMRSRMDSTAPSYGLLGAGSVVKLLPERRNGWVRIAPPANLKVYAAAICVKFDRSKFDEKGEVLIVPETERTIEESAVKAEAPAVKAEVPAVKTEAPAVKTEAPAVKAEVPAVKAEVPAVKAEAPAVKAEAPAVKTEAPAVKAAE